MKEAIKMNEAQNKTPPYGQPLTDENAKLAKYSMVRADGVLGFCIGEVEPGLMAIDPFGSGNKFKIPYKDVTFIAPTDPANPGWYLAPEGGFPENPVPGRWVEAEFRHGGRWSTRSYGLHWPHHKPDGANADIIRFRLIDDPVADSTGDTHPADSGSAEELSEREAALFDAAWNLVVSVRGGSVNGYVEPETRAKEAVKVLMPLLDLRNMRALKGGA
jgi:hypothetical protein